MARCSPRWPPRRRDETRAAALYERCDSPIARTRLAALYRDGRGVAASGPRAFALDGAFPLPALGRKDVLVEVRATAINPVDWKIMNVR